MKREGLGFHSTPSGGRNGAAQRLSIRTLAVDLWRLWRNAYSGRSLERALSAYFPGYVRLGFETRRV